MGYTDDFVKSTPKTKDRKWVWVNDNDRVPLDQLMQAYVTTRERRGTHTHRMVTDYYVVLPGDRKVLVDSYHREKVFELIGYSVEDTPEPTSGTVAASRIQVQ